MSISGVTSLPKRGQKSFMSALSIFVTDPGTKDALQFLMTREITHMKAFMAALESMGKDPLDIGAIPPTPGVIDQFFNDSTGEGNHGEMDHRGPWNEADDIQFVAGPAQPIAEATAEEVTQEIEKAVGRTPQRATKSRTATKRGR
jgi:Mn-containing catalase